jgi:peptidase E
VRKKKPIYLLAGGNWRKANALIPVFKNILAETEKKQPKVAYIGAANNDDPSFFKFFESSLGAAGVPKVSQVLLARQRADVKSAQSILGQADAIFVAGGGVDEGMHWLNRHNLVSFMRQLYDNGALFFGLSAGSIMLGEKWVRWRNPDDDSTAELFGCMQIAPIVCDMHAEEDDWEELKVAVKLLGKDGVGYGIPTEGIIRVAGDGTLTALTKNAVCYINNANRVMKSEDLSVD